MADRLQDTCKDAKCNYLKKGQKKEGCPNFVQLTFTPLESNQPYITNDCAPVRTVLMVMDIINSNLGLQAANEQARNQASREIDILKYIVKSSMGTDIDDVIPIERAKAKLIGGN